MMTDKNIEMMKKLLDEKKQKSTKQNSKLRPGKSMGETRKAIKSNKQGGQFDK